MNRVLKEFKSCFVYKNYIKVYFRMCLLTPDFNKKCLENSATSFPVDVMV